MLFTAAVIVLLNTCPVSIARNRVFYAKRESLLPRAALIGASVGDLESLTPESVQIALDRLETDGLARVTVLGGNMDELCSVTHDGRGYEERVLFSVCRQAMEEGRGAFRSSLSGGAFVSYACAPVWRGGEVAACVGVYEADAVQGALVMGIQDGMAKISVVLGLVCAAVSVLLSRTLSAGLPRILTGIRKVREGDYSFRAEVRGNDEFTMLAEEFNNLTERMQQTEERRRRFVSDASHELKTPLAAIRLLSDSILENENMDAATVREFVAGIGEESERLARTTAQLLDLTKLDRGGAAARTDVDCVRVARRVLSALEPVAKKAGVTVSSRFDPNCRVMATEDDIFRIIHNLVDNAVKYNTENGRVSLTVLRDGDRVVITVEDTGIGIPEEDLPLIFDRFYRVEKSRDREEGGTGLGLSIVKSAADRHGGTVAVRRLLPHGAAFTVTFPGTAEER